MVSAALDELLDGVAALREGHGADLVLRRDQNEGDEGSADVQELHDCEVDFVVVVRREGQRRIERRLLGALNLRPPDELPQDERGRRSTASGSFTQLAIACDGSFGHIKRHKVASHNCRAPRPPTVMGYDRRYDRLICSIAVLIPDELGRRQSQGSSIREHGALKTLREGT